MTNYPTYLLDRIRNWRDSRALAKERANAPHSITEAVCGNE